MKNKIKFILLLAVICVSALALISCWGANTSDPKAQTLSAPKVLKTDIVLTWDQVQNASEYKIFLNDKEVLKTAELSYTFTETNAGKYEIKVQAIGDGKQYLDSADSNVTTFEIENDRLFVNVMDAPFNAKGDGVTSDSKAIRSAIEYVSLNGGGQVYLPAGHTFLTGNIYLLSNVNLHFGDGAKLLQTTDLSDYVFPLDSGIVPQLDNETYKRGDPYTPAVGGRDTYGNEIFSQSPWPHAGTWNFPFVYTGPGVKNASITGNGILGQQHETCATAVHASVLGAYDTENFIVSGLTIQDYCGYGFDLTLSEDVLVNDLKIHRYTCTCNDGMHIVMCQNVRVTNCYFETGDDTISIISQWGNPQSYYGNRWYSCVYPQHSKNIEIDHSYFTGPWKGLAIFPWSCNSPDMDIVQMENLNIHDNYFSSVGIWHNSAMQVIWDGTTAIDRPFPIKNVRWINNTVGAWAANPEVSDLVSNDPFWNKSMTVMRNGDFDYAGSGYWVEITENGSVAEIRGTVEDNRYGYISGFEKGNARLYQGIYMVKSSYVLTADVKVADGTTVRLFVEDQDGNTVATRNITSSDSRVSFTFDITEEKNYRIGIEGGEATSGWAEIDNATLERYEKGESLKSEVSTLSQWNAHSADRKDIMSGTLATDWLVGNGIWAITPDNWGGDMALTPDGDGAFAENYVHVPENATNLKVGFDGWKTLKVLVKAEGDVGYYELYNAYHENWFTTVSVDLSAYAGQDVHIRIYCAGISSIGFSDRADVSEGVSSYTEWTTNADICHDWKVVTGLFTYAEGVAINSGYISNTIKVPEDNAGLYVGVSDNWSGARINVYVNDSLFFESFDPKWGTAIDLSAFKGEEIDIKLEYISSSGSSARACISSLTFGAEPLPMLSTPVLTLTDNVKLSWDAVANVSSYIVYLNGNALATVNTNEYSFSTPLSRGSTVTVKAIGDGENYMDSQMSKPVTYFGAPSTLSRWNAHNDDRSDLTGTLRTDWTPQGGDWKIGIDNWGNATALSPATDGAYIENYITVPADNPVLCVAFNGWVTYKLYVKGENDADFVKLHEQYHQNYITSVSTDLSAYAGQNILVRIYAWNICSIGFTDRVDALGDASSYESWMTNAEIFSDWSIASDTMSYAEGVNIGGGQISNMIKIDESSPVLKLTLGQNWKYSKLDVLINGVVVFDDVDPLTTNTFDLSAYAGQTVKITLAHVPGWSSDERPCFAKIEFISK